MLTNDEDFDAIKEDFTTSDSGIVSSNSTDTNADKLLSGYTWSNNQTGLTLTYKFHQGYQSYWALDTSSDYSTSGMTAFTTAQKNAVHQILDMISTFTKITFTEVGGTTDPQIGFINANASETDLGGSAYYPTGWQGSGDVFINKNFWGYADSDAQGSTNFLILMHEIGHTLGLRHSFDLLSGVYASEQYSVMAYDHSSWGNVNPSTYMLYDIAALQELYGANTNYNSGNTVYAVSSNTAYTIWDGGGNDTLDGSSYGGGMTLNLHAGTYSSVGLTENIAIAYNVTIENANAGGGNDTVYGNDADNIINLNGGNDTVYFSAGHDTVDGGSGNDTMRLDDVYSNYIYSLIGNALEIEGANGTSVLTSVENFIFTDMTKSLGDLELIASVASAHPAPLQNRVLLLDPVTVHTVADSTGINTAAFYSAKTIALSFETGADVTTRQVLYEEGGGLRGLNIFIENGHLYEGIWNYSAGTSWGWKEISTNVDANTNYTTTLVFNATDSAHGTITGSLNGTQFAQTSGTGYLYGHSEDTGIGEMIDQSRFHGDNEYGDGHLFTGTITKLVEYSSALSGTALTQLEAYTGYHWIDGPTAKDDNFTGAVNAVISGNVLSDNGNGLDTDPNNGALTVTAGTFTTAHGASVSLSSNGAFTYAPVTSYTGRDSFDYSVQNSDGSMDNGTVHLTIGTPPPEAPAQNQTVILDSVSVHTLADNININTANYYNAKTIGLSFETGADITTRQVIYEQGGGMRGLNIYVENGHLYEGIWNYGAGTSWGWKEISTTVAANTDYTTALVFNATSGNSGIITGYLDGTQFSQVSDIGYLYGHAEDTGIGQMVDQSRFHGNNEYGDGYVLTGTVEKLVEYSSALSGSGLDDLNHYLSYGWTDGPKAKDDNFTSAVNSVLTGNLLSDNGNGADIDPNNSALHATVGTFSTDQGGSVTISSNGSFSYTSPLNYAGSDTFNYTVSNATGGSDTATVHFTIGNSLAQAPTQNRVLMLDSVNVHTVADSTDINTAAFYSAKTIALSFETGADVNTRQVLYEEGGGLRGLNIFIENGHLYEGIWNYSAGTSWGWKEISTNVSANSDYSATLVFNATDNSHGSVTGYLNGTQFAQTSGTGYLYSHSEDTGIGEMIDQSRFHGDNEYGDGHLFTGTISKLVEYSSALSGTALTQLNNYVGNVISGTSGDDHLYGTSANEKIMGDDGNDHIYGNGGSDELYGGNGNDVFWLGAITAFQNVDTVKDFDSAHDSIDISNLLIGFDAVQSAIDDFVHMTSANGNTTISVDRDGTGTGYQSQAIATVSNVTGLDADDMIHHGSLIVA